MGVKLCLVVLLLAVAVAPHSSSYIDGIGTWTRFHGADSVFLSPGGDIFGEGKQKAIVSEASRRQLYGEGKYLSYDALKRDNVPCGRRGNSYYNCKKRKRANPYRRGCAAITGCARFTD